MKGEGHKPDERVLMISSDSCKGKVIFFHYWLIVAGVVVSIPGKSIRTGY